MEFFSIIGLWSILQVHQDDVSGYQFFIQRAGHNAQVEEIMLA
jgi:hypothetical protein